MKNNDSQYVIKDLDVYLFGVTNGKVVDVTVKQCVQLFQCVRGRLRCCGVRLRLFAIKHHLTRPKATKALTVALTRP